MNTEIKKQLEQGAVEVELGDYFAIGLLSHPRSEVCYEA
jgi:hypothetical protein